VGERISLNGFGRSPDEKPTLTALLGPTNTGKTHRAVERMQRWRTGMIGLPLRLLAREVYDRMTAAVGEKRVALVTGEEKRIPGGAGGIAGGSHGGPDYWVCTVESMPLEREVEFLAVDEIQLAAHEKRGHVFTDRLLNARGTRETWFMGSDTMRPLLEQLLPTATIREHPRFSSLRSAGSSTLGLLPPRSALVAFSASQVYELSERVRRRKGGAAVVLGALSPRTRNAQVALYQSGEVDYVVATDAIGMGLNLDIDHVAFAATRKFDGRQLRELEPAELAQIAGRAGRYLNDGTFGTLAPLPPLPEAVNRAVESHRFPFIRRIFWRNRVLDAGSLDALVASLKRRPGRPELRLVHEADDYEALCHFAARPEIRRRVTSPELVELLWEVCRIPDYGNHPVEHHARLLGEVFDQLAGRNGTVDESWLERNVQRVDDTAGDIDTLMMRIELVRTWTYISHHARWVKHAARWQERTQAVEERLSDALHEKLVARFVDTGSRSRARPGRPAGSPRAGARADTRTDPRLDPAPPPAGPFSGLSRMRPLLRSQGGEQAAGDQGWVRALVEAPHHSFGVDERGNIRHGDRVVGRLARGTNLLHPEVRIAAENLGAGALLQVRRRLAAWTRDLVNDALGPLARQGAEPLSPAGRGLLYQLEQNLGTVAAAAARDQVKHLTGQDRLRLQELRVCLGRRAVYLADPSDASRIKQRAALCAAFLERRDPLPLPGPGSASMEIEPGLDRGTYLRLGFLVFGPCAVRADTAERIDRLLRELGAAGPFRLPAEVAGWLGCPGQQLPRVIEAFGFRRNAEGLYERKRPRRQKRSIPP
jgi:ATP-dependent RNA helicase SUPV3L1/SUV3